MTDTTPGAALDGGPGPAGLTDAEKLAALETYIKTLKAIGDALRARVTEDLGGRRVEKVGAYLPDGTKMGAVGYSAGRKGVTVDADAALAWCMTRYPDEVVTTHAVNPAFLTALADYAKKVGAVGEPGVDPRTGEVLDFIQVRQGAPFVTVTTTPEGKARMSSLATGFTASLEAAPLPVETGQGGGSIRWSDGMVTYPNWTGVGATVAGACEVDNATGWCTTHNKVEA